MYKEKEPTKALIPLDAVDENKDMNFPKKHTHFIVDKLKKIEKHNESLQSENNDLKEKVYTMTKELHTMSHYLHTMHSESQKFQEESQKFQEESRKFQKEMRDILRIPVQENQELTHQIKFLTNENSSKAQTFSKEPAIDTLKLKSPSKISKISGAWDVSQISRWMKLSNRNLTATNSAEKGSSLSVALLNLKCVGGTYSWNFRFDTKESWIFSGIIEEKDININSMPYESSYGLSFSNSRICHMELKKQPEPGLQTLKYLLDMNKGRFEVYQNSDLIAESCNGSFKGKLMRPFIILEHSQNTVTIVR